MPVIFGGIEPKKEHLLNRLHHLLLHHQFPLLIKDFAEFRTNLSLRAIMDVYYLYEDDFKVYNLDVPTYKSGKAQHLGITYKGRDGRIKVIIPLTALEEYYGGIHRDYFNLNSYAFVISHEFFHAYIIQTPKLDQRDKYKWHRLIDTVGKGDTLPASCYGRFEFDRDWIYISYYKNAEIINMFMNIIDTKIK